MELDRRLLLSAGLGGGAALMSGCASKGETATAAEITFPELYDVSVPEQNLEAFVKVMGDLSDQGVWLTAEGMIYLLREGEMPLPFVGVKGLRYVKFVRQPGGFKQYVRDWAVYRDIHTKQVLKDFKNPITQKVVSPKPILTPYFGWDLDSQTGQNMEGYTGDAWLFGRPFKAPWVRDGNDLTVTLELLVRYSSGIGGGEWVNLMSTVNELNNPDLTQTACRFQWTGHSPIMHWLDMSEVKGRTLWNSIGKKHTSLDSISEDFLKDFTEAFPGSLQAPETYQKPK